LEYNLLDASWLTEPQSTQARLRGDRVLYDSSDEAFVPGVIALVGESDIAKQEDFQQAYDKAVELKNKKGVKYYGALIEKYMKVNAKVV
ncbi:UNVERIFIED_CONTAM: ABC transporter substrate-binding protein, partial [Prevotella sp. 15_C9]